MENPSPTRERMYFLDNLRTIVILLVIFLHGAMVYMAYAPEWWYVLDRQRSEFFTLLVLAIDVANMQAMFMLAGYFALPSLRKRGARGFLKDKALRIGLPWAFGAIFLAPLVTYLIYVIREIPVGYLDFWRGDFWGPLYQQSAYWFLGVLFLLFVLVALGYAAIPRLQGLAQEVVQPGWKLWLGFGLLMIAATFLIGLVYPLDGWNRAIIFMVQPVRVPLYLGYFVLGIIAWRQGWFTPDGIKPEVAPWVLVAGFSGLGYLALRILGPQLPGLNLRWALTAITFNLFCLAAIIAGIAVLREVANTNRGAWGSLSANSYGMYYIHPLILFPIAYLFTAVNIPLAIKSSLVILLAILLSWAFSALVLKKVPGVREIFR